MGLADCPLQDQACQVVSPNPRSLVFHLAPVDVSIRVLSLLEGVGDVGLWGSQSTGPHEGGMSARGGDMR